MAQVVPPGKAEFLQWCTDHQEKWSEQATQIGLTAAQVTAWKETLALAVEKFDAAMVARDEARSATMTSDHAISACRASTAELVRTIKNFAISTNNPEVYALANIPAPTPPGELPPPGQPTDLRAQLEPDGALTIRWKTNNAKGVNAVVYMVQRRTGLSGPFNLVGAAGGRSFLDDTVPIGQSIIQYKVHGLRGSTAGPASQTLTVFFGIADGGGLFIARTEQGDDEPALRAAA